MDRPGQFPVEIQPVVHRAVRGKPVDGEIDHREQQPDRDCEAQIGREADAAWRDVLERFRQIRNDEC